ncbi:MAG: hypothetical protein GX752_08315 [Clostridium sp.]|nr:hypothetical protein [Clostridium sp.]
MENSTEKLIVKSYTLTEGQSEYLGSKENSSKYLRDLIDEDMLGNLGNVPPETILNQINYKTAILLTMMNQIMKSSSEHDNVPWSNKQLSSDINLSRTFREASVHYQTLLKMRK